MTNLLSPDGTTLDASLQPLVSVLTDAPNPYPVLAWLRRSPAARLLGQLVSTPDELNHAALDALPQGHATTYVRNLLTSAGLLPPRDEHLTLLINWMTRTLAKLPAHQGTLIHPFAEWHIVRDARRRSAHGRYTYTAHKGDCGNIRAAIDFLTWLDTQQTPSRTSRRKTWTSGQSPGPPCGPAPSPSSAGLVPATSPGPA
ncbi:hypothetical protein [Streptomyces sp. NPDC088760]|uniref:hypothetical protein n=1 Tax=Streptomyces sp. NPDC088760 TaxID=3365890 RepID=UPI0038182F41